MATETGARPGAAVALWTAAVLFAALAVAKIALYGDFTADSGVGCVSRQNPDFVASCEQFEPAAWYLPYWLAVLGYTAFAVLFAVAAVRAARGAGRRFALVVAVLAVVLAVVPGVFDLGWRFAIAASSEPDRWVAEYVRDGVPGWYGPVEAAALVAAALAAVVAVLVLRRRA
ncbi:hypothetical protein [Glycomyces terrestris]|uniref:Uncharacterized protein n=1 Tax=Glycomyces terrestris TaxID=2493553 RepID=A0A426UVE2_9ACTN|nr:hypothetical protein [Glycomyces terrestris]RRR98297.1 hypothetical protein EIW28_15405 [Glycomyces terrestris]